MNNAKAFLESSQDIIITWGFAALLIAVIIALQWSNIKSRLAERKLMKVIRRFGRETMHDIMLPDGLDGSTYIEHLVLTAHAIVVVYVKRYRGLIFNGQHIDEWTQVLNNNSYRFPNPLRQLEMDTMSIKNILSEPDARTEVDVQGIVLFTQGSEFPKGKPDNVMLFSELEQNLKDFQAGEVLPGIYTAWKRLREKTEPCSKSFIISMRENDTQPANTAISIILLVIAVGWVVSRLFITTTM